MKSRSELWLNLTLLTAVIAVGLVAFCTRGARAQVVGPSSTQPALLADLQQAQRLLPPVTARTVTTTATTIAPRGCSVYGQQFVSKAACIDVDGGPLIVNPQGQIRFHGESWGEGGPPRWFLRVSRAANGDSIN